MKRMSFNRQSFMPLLLAGLIAALLNLPRFHIAFESEIVLGPILTLWIAAYRGPIAAFFVAAISSIPLMYFWESVWPLALFSFEALFVGFFYQRVSQKLVFTDVFFWVFLGMPLAWLSISVTSTIVDSHRIIVMVKQLVNGLICAHIAVVLGLSATLRKFISPRFDDEQPLSLQLTLSRQLSSVLAMILMTSFVFILQLELHSYNQELNKKLEYAQSIFIGDLRALMIENQIAIKESSFLFSKLISEKQDGKEALASLHQRLPRLNTLLVANAKGDILYTSPEINSWSLGQEKMNVSDREYFQEAVYSEQPFISGGLVGRGFGGRLIVGISMGIQPQNERDANLGIIEGSMFIDNFTKLQSSYNQTSKLSGILIDQHGKILFASEGLKQKQLSQLDYEIQKEPIAGHQVLKFTNNNESSLYFFRMDELPWGWKLISFQGDQPLAERIESGFILLALLLILTALIGESLASRISQFWTKPLTVLVDAVKNFSLDIQKPLVFKNAKKLPTELQVLSNALEFGRQQVALSHSQLTRLVEERTLELHKMNEELKKLVTEDPLTLLPNRRAYENKLEHDWKSCRRGNLPLSLVVMDIDHFKQINDNYGHQTGDLVLKHLAIIMNNCLRRDTDMLARIGGEEFSLLLPNTPHDIALKMAETLRLALVTNPVKMPDGELLVVYISGGVATTENFEEVKGKEKLYSLADKALYKAKENGRNRVESAQDL